MKPVIRMAAECQSWKRGTNVKRGSPHSERVGGAVLDTGEQAALYRALRELSCSRCRGVIHGVELFTSEAKPVLRLPVVRLCRSYALFSDRSRLIDALLAPITRRRA